MYTNLDWLIIAFMMLAVAGAATVLLMFLSKNSTIKAACLYVSAVLGIYVMTVSIRIFWPYYTGQLLIAVVLGLMAVGAVLLRRMGGERLGFHRAAHIMAALSCTAGMLNAFM